MQRSACVVLVGLMATLLSSDVYGQRRRGRGSNPAEYCWLSDYSEAKRIARNNDQPMMVVFRCVP